jgi:3-hydroxyisobutyrate dehydrogenase
LTEQQRVGFIGIGNMGGRMSARLLEGGVELAVFDLDPAKVATLVGQGASAPQSIAELVEAVDVVLLSLPDSRAVEAVMHSPGGLVEHARAGQVVVDTTTSDPEVSIRICEELGKKRVTYIDAGISGGAPAADSGTLTLMVGGDEEALNGIRPILEHVAAHIYYMGKSGNGHTTKIINNFLNGVNLAAGAEAMIAAKKAGLDPASVLDVINHSSGMNFVTLNRLPHIVQGDYLEGALSGELMAKDLSLWVHLAESLRVASMLGAPCLQVYRVSNAIGYANAIQYRVIDAIGDLSGGVRVASD